MRRRERRARRECGGRLRRGEAPVGWETERGFYFHPAWNPGRQLLIHPCPDSTFRVDWQVQLLPRLGPDSAHHDSVTTDGVDAAEVAIVLYEATHVPAGARPGETWLLRPDDHVAAALSTPADLAAAARRALGVTS